MDSLNSSRVVLIRAVARQVSKHRLVVSPLTEHKQDGDSLSNSRRLIHFKDFKRHNIPEYKVADLDSLNNSFREDPVRAVEVFLEMFRKHQRLGRLPQQWVRYLILTG